MSLGAAKRMLARKGKDVTLKTWTEGAKDSYEDPSWTSSTSTVRAIRRNRSERESIELHGKERFLDADFLVASDTTVPITNTEQAPQVIDGSEEFEVLAVDGEGVGFQVLLCERRR